MRFSLYACCRHYPGAATGCLVCSLPQPCQPSRKGQRVGLRIDIFEACLAFTHVAACTLALSPYFVTCISRRLQPFRYLHSCSGSFRLEHLPGGTFTHWKTPPFHGAHPLPSVTSGRFAAAESISRYCFDFQQPFLVKDARNNDSQCGAVGAQELFAALLGFLLQNLAKTGIS